MPQRMKPEALRLIEQRIEPPKTIDWIPPKMFEIYWTTRAEHTSIPWDEIRELAVLIALELIPVPKWIPKFVSAYVLRKLFDFIHKTLTR